MYPSRKALVYRIVMRKTMFLSYFPVGTVGYKCNFYDFSLSEVGIYPRGVYLLAVQTNRNRSALRKVIKGNKKVSGLPT